MREERGVRRVSEVFSQGRWESRRSHTTPKNLLPNWGDNVRRRRANAAVTMKQVWAAVEIGPLSFATKQETTFKRKQERKEEREEGERKSASTSTEF